VHISEERESSLGSMYTISKDVGGVILICHDCPHIERVNGFPATLGSPRTQAAWAMQIHSRDKHGVDPVLRSIAKKSAMASQP
jgi:hypothetical protein